jgi:hypothetical protein
VHLDPEKIVTKYRSEFEQPIVELPSPEKVAHRVPVYSLTADGTQDRRRFVGLAIVLLIGAAYFGTRERGVALLRRPLSRLRSCRDFGHRCGCGRGVCTGSDPDNWNSRHGTGWTVETGDETKATAGCGHIDGKPAVARLLTTGERVQFDVNDRAALRIGDPASFSFTLNGIPGRVLGTPTPQ